MVSYIINIIIIVIIIDITLRGHLYTNLTFSHSFTISPAEPTKGTK